MVTPPLAAMDGNTLRLKTATTKSSTRSRRPSTRFRCGCSAAEAALISTAFVTSLLNLRFSLVSGGADKLQPAFPLRLRQARCHFFKHSQVLVDVRLGVLNGK